MRVVRVVLAAVLSVVGAAGTVSRMVVPGVFVTGSQCSTVPACQSLLDTGLPGVMTVFRTAGGSRYYEVHRWLGGSMLLGRDRVSIDGRVYLLGAWTPAGVDGSGSPVGPDDGGSYVQTCGAGDRVFLAPIVDVVEVEGV